MRIFSRKRLLDLCNRQQALLERQQIAIDGNRAEVDELLKAMAEQQEMLERMELQQIRTARDLIQNFHDSLEAEVDEDVLRDGLEIALVDLNDHVARLEEHSGI